MITPDQIAAFKKKIKSGEPEGEVRMSMKDAGFSKADIEKVFEPHFYDMRNWYLFFGCIISAIGLYLSFQFDSLLIFILGSLLFVAYFAERKRMLRLLKKNDLLTSNEEDNH